jgi:alkylation response protein AidB-like acyl-CoA dehydrogenase
VDDYGVPLSESEQAFRDEVRAFLAHHAPDFAERGARSQLDLMHDWQHRLYDAGLAAVGWPVAFGGRGAGPIEQLVFNTEMARTRVPEPINRSAINQLGPTIIQWGTDEQRARYLPRILAGDEVWCQGFSEPDAGSDLASLRTRAVIDGDDLIVNGQKIWTSKAHYADWIYILARTDPDAPKHDGISYVLVDLRTPGIEVRPIRQIAGAAEFSEVFFTDVRVPLANVVGPINEGWRVAHSTLGYERVGQSRTHRIERRLGMVVRLAASTEVDGTTRIEDPTVRARLVDFAARVEALRFIASRATAAGVLGRAPGPEASVAKLLTSEVDQQMATFSLDLAGRAGVLERGSPGAAKGGTVAQGYLVMRAATLGAGTSEIQRNVIGEKLLGLPRSD